MNRKLFLRLLGMGGIGSLISKPSLESSDPEIIKPGQLKKGDTIGLISPASRLPRMDMYDDIIKQVKKLGYGVKVGQHARDTYGYLAGRDKYRAEDLNKMFADNSVDAIMPFRGGWGCNRILHLIDFDVIRENPKILVGFSDITSLLLAIYAKTGLVTFHGPVGKSEWTDYTTSQFRNALRYQQSRTLKSPDNDICAGCSDVTVITPGKAKGRLIGGNLSVLTAMMGSKYLPDWKNKILFLEDVGEDIYRIDRMLTQLKLNGVLDQISGFVFGQCVNCQKANSYSLTLQEVFEDHIKPLGIPAFSGAMFGHLDTMLTLPVGTSATLDAEQGSILLNEPATAED